MEIKRKSVITGVERVVNIPVNPEDLILWENGDASIDDAMPYLNNSDREFILSGITQEEWRAVFAEEIYDSYI